MKIFLAAIIAIFAVACMSLDKGEKYELLPYQSEKLANGLELIYVKDKSLPYFSIQVMVKSGSTNDPITKSGLGYLTANLLEKGSKKRSAVELADSLGQMGSDFSAFVDEDYSLFSASSLSFHKQQLLEDVSEILTQPKFAIDEVKRLKGQVVSQIKKAADDPSSFASMAYTSYIYGSHPYGRQVMGTIRDVKGIDQDDIQKFYEEHYRPNNIVVAVTGQIDDEDKSYISKLLGAWKKEKVESTQFPIFPQISGVQIKLIDKGDLSQTQIRIGHKSIKRTDPDFLELRLAGIVLGGAFSSRLMRKVRIEKGLTYSIGAQFGAQKDYGSFTVSTFTRHEKVGETIQETLLELNKFRKEGLTQEELDMAKALAKGIFPRALETAEKFAQNLLILKYYGIGDEYLKDYYKNIDRISLADVNKAITNHLDPKNIKILVFAPKKKTIDQLREIGILEVEDYSQLSFLSE